LGPAAARNFAYVYDVSPRGNFEHGQSILNRPKPLAECAQALNVDLNELAAELAESRAKLYEAREQRIHPGLDDKVLVAWNGLMIEALATAAGALDEPRYLQAAQRAADFVLTQMRRADGRLLHTWRGGVARLDAYLDDYSTLAAALVALYQADFDERWLAEAARLVDALLVLFEDRSGGGFYFTAEDHETLLTRQKDLYDNAVPSGNSMAALALLRLGKLTGRADYLAAAERTLAAAAPIAQQAPLAMGQMLLALDMYLGPTYEIVLVGDAASPDTAAVLKALRHKFLPNKVVACRAASVKPPAGDLLAALFEGKSLPGPEPGVYVCRNFACQAPVSGKEAALATWRELASLKT